MQTQRVRQRHGCTCLTFLLLSEPLVLLGQLLLHCLELCLLRIEILFVQGVVCVVSLWNVCCMLWHALHGAMGMHGTMHMHADVSLRGIHGMAAATKAL